jgi:hypothetical protein
VNGEEFVSSITGILYYGFNVLFLTPRDNPDYVLVSAVAPSSASQKFVLVGNPTTAGKQVTLQAKQAVNWSSIAVSVIDSKGATQSVSTIAGDAALSLNVSALAPGLYTVRVANTATGYAESQRLVIQ